MTNLGHRMLSPEVPVAGSEDIGHFRPSRRDREFTMNGGGRHEEMGELQVLGTAGITSRQLVL